MKMAATKVMIMAIIDGWPVEFFAFLLVSNDFRSLHVMYSLVLSSLACPGLSSDPSSTLALLPAIIYN